MTAEKKKLASQLEQAHADRWEAFCEGCLYSLWAHQSRMEELNAELKEQAEPAAVEANNED